MSCRSRFQINALAIFLFSILCAAPLLASPVGVTVVIENRAPAGGTWQSPIWLGFHDGGFDFFDAGSAASGALESLAEDGDVSGLNDLFDAQYPDGVRDVLVSGGDVPPLAPGQSVSRTFVLESNLPSHRFFSFASMVLPSNDAFIGTEDPMAHRVFTNSGSFLGGYIPVSGAQVWDAGTEVNDEMPANTAFFGQSNPNTGEDENGTVAAHPGFLAPGMGGILDDPDFVMADFTLPGYDMISITLYRTETTVPPGGVSGTWTLSGAPYMVHSDIMVREGETLTLEPGVLVYFDSGSELLVRGELEAIGTEGSPIKFTGPSTYQAWRGLQVEGESGHAELEHCIVENANRAWDYEYGGAINVEDGTLVARHCVLRENHSWLGGTGIFGDHATLDISHCEIFDNDINSSNSAEGGGILAEYCDVQISDCLIRDNDIRTFTYFGATNSRGGGIAMRFSEGVIERNIITGNYITHSGTNTESAGGGIYVYGGSPTIRNNTIHANITYSNNRRGGGIYIQGYGMEVTNNIVTSNTGSGIWFEADGLNFGHNDVWNNSPLNYGGSIVPEGAGDTTQFNANGDPCDAYFNISADPNFVSAGSGDFHLDSFSLCIDAGDPDSPLDPDGSVADIGALYFARGLSSVPEDRFENTRIMLAAGPAPMTNRSAISFSLPRAGHVKLTVYDVRGRAVRTLLDETRPEGAGQVVFDGRDAGGRHLPSGVYLYRLQTPVGERTNKLSIVR